MIWRGGLPDFSDCLDRYSSPEHRLCVNRREVPGLLASFATRWVMLGPVVGLPGHRTLSCYPQPFLGCAAPCQEASRDLDRTLLTYAYGSFCTKIPLTSVGTQILEPDEPYSRAIFSAMNPVGIRLAPHGGVSPADQESLRPFTSSLAPRLSLARLMSRR
jgi:hypothetical protein